MTKRPNGRSRRWLSLVVASLALSLATPAWASVKSEISFHRGVVAYGNGDLDAAAAAFNDVLAEDASDTAAIHYLGLIAADRGEPARAVEFYQRALAIEPDDIDVRFDLGSALLESGDTAASRREFDRVLAAEPDRATAQLFAGIAAYREGDYKGALPHLDRAVELDESLRSQARYYTGLSQANLQDFPAAADAFSDAEQSPLSPLSDSARNLRQQVSRPGEADAGRRWSLSMSAGMEFDTNPTIAGQTLNQDADGRGVYRISGNVDLYRDETFSLNAGYDGFASTHLEETFVDLMTHVGYLTATANFDPVRFGLRYDFAYTWLDGADQKFRTLNRITPTVTIREGDWGFTQAFYQGQLQDFHFRIPSGFGFINRDGDRHTAGANQFLFPGAFFDWAEPISYVRIGGQADIQNTKGREFRYDGWEVSFGFGANLPLEMGLTVLYRLTGRDYRNSSGFARAFTDGTGEQRDDLRNRLTFELDVTSVALRGMRGLGLSGGALDYMTDHWQLTTAGSFTFVDSDVALYDYNREVIGAYVTYRF